MWDFHQARHRPYLTWEHHCNLFWHYGVNWISLELDRFTMDHGYLAQLWQTKIIVQMLHSCRCICWLISMNGHPVDPSPVLGSSFFFLFMLPSFCSSLSTIFYPLTFCTSWWFLSWICSFPLWSVPICDLFCTVHQREYIFLEFVPVWFPITISVDPITSVPQKYMLAFPNTQIQSSLQNDRHAFLSFIFYFLISPFVFLYFLWYCKDKAHCCSFWVNKSSNMCILFE